MTHGCQGTVLIIDIKRRSSATCAGDVTSTMRCQNVTLKRTPRSGVGRTVRHAGATDGVKATPKVSGVKEAGDRGCGSTTAPLRLFFFEH